MGLPSLKETVEAIGGAAHAYTAFWNLVAAIIKGKAKTVKLRNEHG